MINQYLIALYMILGLHKNIPPTACRILEPREKIIKHAILHFTF